MKTGSKYVVRVVTGGTKLDLAVSARNVDSAMLKLRRNRTLRNYPSAALLFFKRKDMSLADCRSL